MKFQGLVLYMFSYYLQECEGTEAFVVFLIHGNCYLCALSCEVVSSNIPIIIMYYLYFGKTICNLLYLCILITFSSCNFSALLCYLFLIRGNNIAFLLISISIYVNYNI